MSMRYYQSNGQLSRDLSHKEVGADVGGSMFPRKQVVSAVSFGY